MPLILSSEKGLYNKKAQLWNWKIGDNIFPDVPLPLLTICLYQQWKSAADTVPMEVLSHSVVTLQPQTSIYFIED